jgi:hypothetical protein
LVGHAWGKTHQYPDGFMLFLGTMFAPTQDRHGPGLGFTHEVGDVVSISSAKLGKSSTESAQRPDRAVDIRHRGADGQSCGAGIAESAAVAKIRFSARPLFRAGWTGISPESRLFDESPV